MKTIFVALSLPFLCLLILNVSGQSTKHALIFAVGNYPSSGGWPTISSIADVSYVKGVLLKHSFANENIKIYQDGEVTPDGIAKAFNDLQQKIRQGETVLIYFSSHGEQIEDDNGDEVDGLDESIVTYNAIAPDLNGHINNFNIAQKEYVRDDKIGSYISALRSKLGEKGDIAIFMDLCHSGTATKGNKVRGGKPPLVSNSFDRNKFSKVDTAGVFDEKSNQRGKGEVATPYIFISASRAEESDQETRDENNKFVGSLTYSFSKAIQYCNSKSTYRTLFSYLQAEMNVKVPGQNPTIEGNGIDRRLFGGDFVEQKPYIEIDRIDKKQIVLKSGIINGLDTGVVIYVYDANTIDPLKSKALDSGKIVKSTLYQSEATLNNGLKFTQAALGRVFITNPTYNIKPLNLSFIGFSRNEVKSIKVGLSNINALLNFEGAADLILIHGNKADSLIVTSNYYLFDTIKDASYNSSQLQKKLQKYVQYKFLQTLKINEAQSHLDVKLVPWINGIADTNLANRSMPPPVFKVGDNFVLWVKNTNSKAIYFNILDLQPDGIINPVLPNSRPSKGNPISSNDLRVEANSSHLFDKYILTVAPPCGTEIYKIFVSTQPIDLEIIANTKGARGNFSVLEKLVKNSYGITKRGTPDVANLEEVNGSAYDLPFIIKP